MAARGTLELHARRGGTRKRIFDDNDATWPSVAAGFSGSGDLTRIHNLRAPFDDLHLHGYPCIMLTT